MNVKGLFVCGTDTGVGKTYVSALLIRALVQRGYRVAGMKPVASGAVINGGVLINDDAKQLVDAANVVCRYAAVNPYCFASPVAPHIAAQKAATTIDIAVIGQAYRELSACADMVIVEGVGGWYVPINATHTMADVITSLQLPVIMVVGMKLGCLNHSLLTSEAILQGGNVLAGWVANVLDPDMDMLQENIETLRQRLHAPLLGVVKFAETQCNLEMSWLKNFLPVQ